MSVSGLSFLLQFLGCEPSEQNETREQSLERLVAQTPEVIASTHFDKDFQEAFVDNTPKIEKTCYDFKYTHSPTSGDPHNGETIHKPFYTFEGLYGPFYRRQTAYLETECIKHQMASSSNPNFDFIDWTTIGINGATMSNWVTDGWMEGKKDSPKFDSRRFAAVYSGWVRPSFVHHPEDIFIDAQLVDVFVNDFCEKQVANPMSCTQTIKDK
jgi:hypothetical protein